MSKFKLQAPYEPRGDQPEAIRQLTDGFSRHREQTLLGVTGSGKTFTVANVIAKLQVPTLVVSHNKTLAAQLHTELSSFFPQNKVCYFVSYYDYYQPESYLPQQDLYIEKDSQINERIERLRLDAVASLLSRPDVIVVASVSCIYGFGSPQTYREGSVTLKVGDRLDRQELLRRLVGVGYERNDIELKPGRLRVRGDTVDVIPGSSETVIRIELDDDRIAGLSELHPVSGQRLASLPSAIVFPATPFVAAPESTQRAMAAIRDELAARLPQLGPLEAYRLKQRTEYDLEMIQTLGHCKGIENYSRHFDGRAPGTPPSTLLDFFSAVSKDWLMVVDESHVTIPQVGGMYYGDVARKKNLVDYGFRLPSAFDNRPLKFEEFERYLKHVIYVSATPSEHETQRSGTVVEQIIRPTGLIDPHVEVRPMDGAVTDLIAEVKAVTAKGYRVLVTTLTKRLAEDLSRYLAEAGVKSEYLHSEIDTLQRTEILKKLRLGTFDVLVGINLLREGLDLPEVALVAILDADREGFLRDHRSLIQTIGRAARNVEGRVIMYADEMTESMKLAIWETDRRRKKQVEYNTKHGITPQTIRKAIAQLEEVRVERGASASVQQVEAKIVALDLEMKAAAEDLNFEKAIELREQISHLKAKLVPRSPKA